MSTLKQKRKRNYQNPCPNCHAESLHLSHAEPLYMCTSCLCVWHAEQGIYHHVISVSGFLPWSCIDLLIPFTSGLMV